MRVLPYLHAMTHILCGYELPCVMLKKRCQVRYMALSVIGQLFLRSKAVRTDLVADLKVRRAINHVLCTVVCITSIVWQ